MNRRRLILPSFAVLVLAGTWWLCLAVIGSLRSGSGVYYLFPAFLAALALALLYTGRQKAIPGSIAAAAVLFTLSALFFGLPQIGGGTGWWLGWALIPAIAGGGILLENWLGLGWRFTNLQALSLVLVSFGLVTAITLLRSDLISTNPQVYSFWTEFSQTQSAILGNLKGITLFLKNSFLVWR